MKKDPVRAVKYLLIILGTTGVILPIINIFEKGTARPVDITVGVMFLFCSMFVVYGVIKHMAKRIDELEKKLDTNQTERDA
jgi:hypothetical protein